MEEKIMSDTLSTQSILLKSLSKPLLFSIIGAITGLIVSQIGLYAESEAVALYLLGVVLFVINVLLLWGKQTKRFMVLNLGAVAIGLGLLISWNVWQEYYAINKIAPLFVFALIQIGIIATTFAQAWKADKPHYVYTDLFENGWNNHFFFLFSGLLTGGFLLILLLGTTLFDSIGLDVSDIIWNKHVTPIIIATLVGAGIGISREHESLIFKIRSVFFALFKVMAYLAAAIVILFAISLPFSWQGLFGNDSTSIILLSLVGVSILLLNTLVDEESKPIAVWSNRIFRVQIALLSVFSLLSIYAIIVRIQQYGLMPNRIVALSIAIMLGLYSISYGYQMLKRCGQWDKGIAASNPLLAIVWLGVLVALSTPLLDPVRLSVNSQLERLQSGKTSVETFDFYALKYRLGKAGEEALEEIRGWKDHQDYALLEKYIDKPSSRRDPPSKPLMFTMLGEKPPHFSALKESYSAYRCNKEKPCFVKMLDMNRDTIKEAVVIDFRNSYISVDILQYEAKNTKGEKKWVHQRSLSTYLSSNQSVEQSIEALKAGELKLLRPRYDDLQLGGVELRQ
jgi:hypothetical protein